MAKEIVAWCDVHLADDERVVAHTLGVAMRGDNKGVDLCDTCTKQLVEPLAEIIAEYGQRFETGPPAPKQEGKKARKGTPIPCPECTVVAYGASGLSSHLQNKHNMLTADLTEPFMPGEENFALPCPDCNRRFERPQGLGAHRASAHGYKKGDDDVEQPKQQDALTY
jgi:uncharacterized C2H2 Zn-finger protein